ncbi:MAG: IS30 family transposase [Rickettsiales bacterium]|nr:IS30 family transposase [Rickettsiales bacterium]
MNHCKHLNIQERYQIKEMLYQAKTITEIAQLLNRSKGTISMEISRNSDAGVYMPCVAQTKYKSRLHKSEQSKIERNPELQEYIARCMIDHKWSPNAIAGRMKLEGFSETVSTEAIYQYVYTSPIARKLKLYTYLPQRRMSRQTRGERIPRKIIPDRISIHKREAIANEKVELDHFEADLTFHKGNRSKNIGVMVDKLSQKVMLVLNGCKRSLTVTTGFLSKMNSIPTQLRKTLTMDNGKEFVGHVAYRFMGFDTFFCDPYHPRQKALVEKINSMIHRIFPKKIDINTATQKTLDGIADILNNMPRKIFGYKTPNEIWEEKANNIIKIKRGFAESNNIIGDVQLSA